MRRAGVRPPSDWLTRATRFVRSPGHVGAGASRVLRARRDDALAGAAVSAGEAGRSGAGAALGAAHGAPRLVRELVGVDVLCGRVPAQVFGAGDGRYWYLDRRATARPDAHSRYALRAPFVRQDCLITDSFELPIMKVSVAILTRLREEILALEDMEEIIELLRKTVPSWKEARLMDLLTEALSSPWTAQDKAVLAEGCGESVADAVRRVGGGDDEGRRESPPAWEPEWEEAEEAEGAEGAEGGGVGSAGFTGPGRPK